MRYRKEVITQNFSRVFPNKNFQEIAELRDQFYQQFSITLAEIMYAYTYPEQTVNRVEYLNFNEINKLAKEGKSVILCGGHFYNWEWAGINLAKAIESPVYGIYKPLSNKYFNSYLKEMRSDLGVNLIAMRETKKIINERIKLNQSSIYVLGSDQSPTYTRRAIWVDFFKTETAFFPGIEFFSSAFDLPVFVLSVLCPKKGYYTVEAKRLEPKNGSLTQAFADHIAEEIVAHPEAWLWSHNRWKHIKP